MRWGTAADAAFGMPEGFFIGPYGQNGRASIGTYPRTTSRMLAAVAQTGEAANITERERDIAKADLAYWHADCIALAHVPNEHALRETLTALFGPGTAIMDTWTWKVP